MKSIFSKEMVLLSVFLYFTFIFSNFPHIFSHIFPEIYIKVI